MKKVLAILCYIIGAVLGLYIGVYLLFIGGIIDVINAIKTNFPTTLTAMGICKIVFCELGAIPTYIFWVIATFLMGSEKRKSFKRKFR